MARRSICNCLCASTASICATYSRRLAGRPGLEGHAGVGFGHVRTGRPHPDHMCYVQRLHVCQQLPAQVEMDDWAPRLGAAPQHTTPKDGRAGVLRHRHRHGWLEATAVTSSNCFRAGAEIQEEVQQGGEWLTATAACAAHRKAVLAADDI